MISAPLLVAEKELAWRRQQPQAPDGNRILIQGYESHLTDVTDTRRVQFNKLSMNTAGNLEALLHRPLREGNPWDFGLQGISEESLEPTNNQCVTHQLSKYLQIKGEPQFGQNDMFEMLTSITENLYNDEEDADLRDPNVGFTAAAILQLCKDIDVPIHIKWGENKIMSFTPEKSIYDTVALYIWGDHCFTVGNERIKKSIVREPVTEPSKASPCVLARMGKRTNTAPAAQYWEKYTKLQPGNFRSEDLLAVRADLLRNHICPKVQLSGTGIIKSLRYNDCVIHRWPQEALICLKFLEEYSKIRHHSVSYRGESLSGFCQMIFDDLCRQTDRPFITKDIKCSEKYF